LNGVAAEVPQSQLPREKPCESCPAGCLLAARKADVPRPLQRGTTVYLRILRADDCRQARNGSLRCARAR
jgi:hypothetical protein